MKKNIFRGRIVDVFKETDSFAYMTQGIKKKEQPHYDGFMLGGNGTYITYPIVNRYLFLKIVVYNFTNKNENSTEYVDVRKVLMKLYNRKKVTDKFVEDIKAKLKGEKITVYKSSIANGEYSLFVDLDDLRLLLD